MVGAVRDSEVGTNTALLLTRAFQSTRCEVMLLAWKKGCSFTCKVRNT